MVSFARTPQAVIEIAQRNRPTLIVCDLHVTRIDLVALARQLKADATFQSIPLLGFFSHLQTDLQKAAEQAGFDQVIPRSKFARDLSVILLGEAVESGNSSLENR